LEIVSLFSMGRQGGEKKERGTFACTTIFNLKLNIDTGLGMSLS
jgi:hypothetical protein